MSTYLIPVKSNDSIFDTTLAKAYTQDFAKRLKEEFQTEISEKEIFETVQKILGSMEVKVRTTNKKEKLDAAGNPLPKKEATGFVKFSSEQRKAWTAQAKKFQNDTELRAELSKMWKEMSEEAQLKYFPNGRKSPKKAKAIEPAKPIETKFLTSSQANKMKVDELKSYVQENIQAFIGRKPELTIDIIKSMKKTDLVVLVKV